MTSRIQHAIDAHLGDGETIALADGFDEAFVGIARQFDKPFAVYDRVKCLKALLDQGMSIEEAEEYFSFNTEGAWVGDTTPAFMHIDESDQFRVIEALAKQVTVTSALLRILAGHVHPELARNGEEEEACAAALKTVRRLFDLGTEGGE